MAEDAPLQPLGIKHLVRPILSDTTSSRRG
jgi:hypothetical protein